MKTATRCRNKERHHLSGPMLAIIHRDSIYIQCRDRKCKRWTRIQFNVPGIDLDLTTSGITQEVMPPGYHFDIEPAATVIWERK